MDTRFTTQSSNIFLINYFTLRTHLYFYMIEIHHITSHSVCYYVMPIISNFVNVLNFPIWCSAIHSHINGSIICSFEFERTRLSYLNINVLAPASLIKDHIIVPNITLYICIPIQRTFACTISLIFFVLSPFILSHIAYFHMALSYNLSII